MLASCTATNDLEQLEAGQDSIIGGQPEAGYPAVVLLASWPDDLSVLALCTATLVAPDVLLTAAHCVDPETHPNWNFGVFQGNDASAFPTASTLVPQLLPVAAVHVHPDYDRDPPFKADIALVELPAPLTEEPMPISPLKNSPEGIDTDRRDG